MTLDEGYIKYDSHWTPTAASHRDEALQLERWRQPLFANGLIGVYIEENIGFGNMSCRLPRPPTFLITGTQTGHLAHTDEKHYARVDDYDIAANRVTCSGPVQASSEAMTHAAIYELDDQIGAVVHVHSAELWREKMNVLPTTDRDIAYGTPAMAREFTRLFLDTSFAVGGVAVMAGHDDGLISFGASVEHAARRILALL